MTLYAKPSSGANAVSHSWNANIMPREQINVIKSVIPDNIMVVSFSSVSMFLFL
jgi:hypothetical protein